MTELHDGLFLTNIPEEEIPSVVPGGLGLEDLSGWELLLWAEGNLPKAFSANKVGAQKLCLAIFELCNRQIAAANELELPQEATAFANTKTMIRNGVTTRELSRASLDELFVTQV